MQKSSNWSVDVKIVQIKSLLESPFSHFPDLLRKDLVIHPRIQVFLSDDHLVQNPHGVLKRRRASGKRAQLYSISRSFVPRISDLFLCYWNVEMAWYDSCCMILNPQFRPHETPGDLG